MAGAGARRGRVAARRRAAEGFSTVQAMAGKLARRLAGGREAPWWGRLMDEGGPARAAMLWRIARMAQAAGISFNLGISAAWRDWCW